MHALELYEEDIALQYFDQSVSFLQHLIHHTRYPEDCFQPQRLIKAAFSKIYSICLKFDRILSGFTYHDTSDVSTMMRCMGGLVYHVVDEESDE